MAVSSALELKPEIQGVNLFVKKTDSTDETVNFTHIFLSSSKKTTILITQFIAWVTSLDFRRIGN